MDQEKGTELVEQTAKQILSDMAYTAPELIDWKLRVRLSDLVMAVEAELKK